MGSNIQTIKDIRQFLSCELSNLYEAEEINSIANNLIRTATGLSRLHEIYNSDQKVSDIQVQKIIRFSHELKSGKPLQYVLGETEFYGCKIRLNGSTLIPRPETEELTDLIIKENFGFNGSILDLGTGSGCIAIALSKNLPDAKVFGIDKSDDAIKMAQINNSLNNTNVVFTKADLLNSASFSGFSAEIIVSNPPYVRNSEKALMKSNVLDYEPHDALFVPDSDPLLFYRSIIKISESVLTKDGSIYLEINEALGKEMMNLLESSFFKDVIIFKDLNGRERIIKAKNYG